MRLNLERPFTVTSKKARCWAFCIVVFLFLSYAFRGLCQPWSYGYFNYTVNWTHGYIPRGFVGTVLKILNGNQLPSYFMLESIQYVIAFLFLAYLCYVIYKLVYVEGNLLFAIVLAIFSVSVFNMFYLEMIGFLDHIAYLLVAICMEICIRKDIKTCLATSGMLSALIPLIFETGAFTICPIIFSITVIHLIQSEPNAWKKYIPYVVGVYAPTIAIIVGLRFIPVSAETMDLFLNEASNYSYYNEAFYGIAQLFKTSNLTDVVLGKWIYIPWEVVLYSAIIMGLVSFFLIYTKVESKVIVGYFVFCLLSGFASYLTIYFGTDYHRYYFAVVESIFLISVYMLLFYRKRYLSYKLGIILSVLAIMVVIPIADYRLWIWNRAYNDFWFEILLNKI